MPKNTISTYTSAKYRNSLIPMFWSRHFWADLAKYVVFLGVAIFFLRKMLGQNSQNFGKYKFLQESAFSVKIHILMQLCVFARIHAKYNVRIMHKIHKCREIYKSCKFHIFYWNPMNNWRKTYPKTGFLHISLVILENALILFFGPATPNSNFANTASFPELGASPPG